MEKNNSVRFEIVGEIKTKQRPRARVVNSKYASVYTPKDTINYENYIKSEYQRQSNVFFGDDPLTAVIYCYFKLPKDKEAKFKNHPELISEIGCMVNKDTDNIAKIVLDSLNNIAYYDDKQIVKLLVEKEYTTDQERIVVELYNNAEYKTYDSLIVYKNYLDAKNKYLTYFEELKAESEHRKLKKTEQEKIKNYANKYFYYADLVNKGKFIL